jgi:DNA-binding beta-propeller fold protein YncE
MSELSRLVGAGSREEPGDEAPALGGARAVRMHVDTLAGDGLEGFADGDGRTARFNLPWGVAVDASGNVYVADSGNHRIRKITPEGLVSTLAGDGTKGHLDGEGPGAWFSYPRALAFDRAGSLYVVDNSNDRIRKISPQGLVTTHSGDGVRGFYDGPRVYARFSLPNGIAVDDTGACYVADTTNYRIRKVSPGGTASTVAGDGMSGYADALGVEARFSSPRGIALDAAGNLYVVECGNSRVRMITPDGRVTTLAGDGRGKHADGVGTAASFKEPCGIAVDAANNLYIADTDNQCIRLVSPDGRVTTIAGAPPEADYADGPGPQARFSTPTGICVGPTGIIYVADSKNHCIRRITPM